MMADAEHTITITNNLSKFSEDHVLNTLLTSVRFYKFMVLGWNPTHLAGVMHNLRYAKDIWQPFAVDNFKIRMRDSAIFRIIIYLSLSGSFVSMSTDLWQR